MANIQRVIQQFTGGGGRSGTSRGVGGGRRRTGNPGRGRTTGRGGTGGRGGVAGGLMGAVQGFMRGSGRG